MNPSQARKLSEPIAPEHKEMFSGTVYEVGTAAASIRAHSGKTKYSIIAVHGFLQNHCYFTHLYHAPDNELILFTCSNYHVAACGPTIEEATWHETINEIEGTIGYDAEALNQVVENLPTAPYLRIHGHSRGCSVILEAIRRQPGLYKKAEIILEAPVLPQGRLHPNLSALLKQFSYGMWPYLIRLARRTPLVTLGSTFFGKMNERKRELLNTAFSNTKDQLTIVRNVESMLSWMSETDFTVYKHVKRGSILIPDSDKILDRQAMLESAQKTPRNIHIIETTDTSHLISLDTDVWIPPMGVKPVNKSS